MASSTAPAEGAENGPDQQHINCAICNRQIAYNRWSSGSQKIVCSPECQTKLEEITGDRTSEKYLLQRAADPNICIMCAAPLEDKVRSTKIYCSWRCAKRAYRKGINADKLMRIRKSAINGGKSES